MATRRKDGRIQESFFFEGKRFFVYGRTKAEINSKIANKIEELKSLKQKHDNPTLESYNRIYTESKKNKVKESTLRNYKYWFQDAAELTLNCGIKFAELKMQDIKPSDIREIQLQMIALGQSARTVNGVMAHLSNIFEMAVKDETISKNPCVIIETVKNTEVQARNTIHRALSVEETHDFMQSANDSFYINHFKIMLQTGMRIGEVGALSGADIDTKKNIIKITKTITRNSEGIYIIGSTPKTSTGTRNIPMNEVINGIISDQKERNRKYYKFAVPDRLFATPEGALLREYQINREIKRICERCGIDKFTCHAFRATFATRFIEQRPQDYKILSEILGHANTKITLDLYTHAMTENKEKAMQNLLINF